MIDIELTPAQLEGSAAFSTDDSRPGELVMTWRALAGRVLANMICFVSLRMIMRLPHGPRLQYRRGCGECWWAGCAFFLAFGGWNVRR